MKFITENHHRWGVEPICKMLQIAPSSYYAAIRRPPAPRRQRDAELEVLIQRVWDDNRQVYGADKIWAELKRQGEVVARCTVERLMRRLGLRGVVRGKRSIRTTVASETDERPRDLVGRQFQAEAPNRLWVADLTYVKTQQGWVYVAFVIDVCSRRVVGWRVSASARAELALEALDMARFSRSGTDLTGLIHHSDRGSQYLAVRYTQRLAEAGMQASVGSRGDSYDNALAESFNGLYKTELIHHHGHAAQRDQHGQWRGLKEVEHATMEYVHWFNTKRVHGALGMITPAEHEATFIQRWKKAS